MRATSIQPTANPRKILGVRQLGPVDISALRTAVLAIPKEVWQAENAAKPNRFGMLEQTRHIVFRFVDSPLDWRASHNRALWPQWRDLLEPVLDEAVAAWRPA